MSETEYGAAISVESCAIVGAGRASARSSALTPTRTQRFDMSQLHDLRAALRRHKQQRNEAGSLGRPQIRSPSGVNYDSSTPFIANGRVLSVSEYRRGG